MDKTRNSELDDLDDLLDAERGALLKGDLEGLARMAENKERLFRALNQSEQNDLAALTVLDHKVKRNQLLLDSALEGIRTVARKMSALRRIRASLDTYDATGQKRIVDVDTTRSIERRA